MNSGERLGPCQPLKSVDELLSFRKYCCSFRSAKNCSSEDCFKTPLPNRPRVLLCHDFAGGYLEDRYQCSSKLFAERKLSAEYDPKKDYYFRHWDRIDMFVYFSHNFISVPPCTWVRQAHENGVKVLGTIIIEWNTKAAEEFLSPGKREEIISSLIDLCVEGGFDGWFFNMEVSLAKNYVQTLCDFISELKTRLARTSAGSLVLWYDSLTASGQLDYRNELSLQNKPFFDVSDGIFLNYSWNEQCLKRSKELAKDRAFDVYVGIDTFGRKTKYEAGFNSTHVANGIIQQGLSTAIFAPGWVLECNKFEEFSENQEKFWGVMPVLR